jgi:DNA-binding SARP family transcriptional activator
MLAAAHRRSVSHDEIAEELWPTEMPRAWETAVRVVVSKLRGALRPFADPAGEAIVASPGSYRLLVPRDGRIDLDEMAVSIHRAEAELGAGRFEAAGAEALVASMITSRPFLPAFDGPWATATREGVVDTRLRALACLAEVWLAKGDHGQAARDAQAILRLDPYREPAHRLLMRSRFAAGDRGSAARSYEACRRLLADDLGVAPAPETVRVAAELGLG